MMLKNVNGLYATIVFLRTLYITNYYERRLWIL